MGASMVKSCFGGDCLWTPSDPTPRVCKRTPAVGPRQYDTTRRAHILKQPQERYVSPTKNAARLPAPHHHSQLQHWPCNSVPSREALRKLSPYEHQQQQWYATERRKLKNLASSLSSSVRGPRRERWGSRESTCSSSSGTEDEHGITIGHNDRDVRRRSRRSPPHVRSWASTAFSEESFYHSFHENNATPASVNSARRLSRASSPSFGFEDLLPECYVLEELIGSGTTSKCYRCRRTTDGRLFACKIINKRRLAFDCHQRDEIARQLRREVDVLRRLDHPNIAKLEDAFENETYILLVMELLEGGELFETIIDRVRLTESDAKHVAKSVLSAISYMHAQGIVHRDIKPENLLLTTNCSPGKPLHVKIVDFGFASSIDTKTTMTSFLGTGGYLAPEILLQRPYTSAVDMWAFGVLLFLMLCGRLPFTTSTQLQPNQRLSAVFRLTFPEKYWRGVSRPARDLLQKILVLNPSYRLSAADALNHHWFQNE